MNSIHKLPTWAISAFLITVIAVPILSGYGGYAAYQQAKRPATIPTVPHQPLPSGPQLDQIIKLSEAGTQTIARKTISVPYWDSTVFKDHLLAAATRNGWFAAETTRDTLHITMPKEELRKLDDLEQAPNHWVVTESSHNRAFKTNQNIAPVKAAVEINITDTKAKGQWQIAAAIGFMAAVLTGISSNLPHSSCNMD